MFNKQEVQHIAKLARLSLREKEIKKFQKDLSAVLDYFDKLKGVEVSDVKTTSHIFGAINVMREDEAGSTKSEVRKKMMELAPETKNGYLKVKPITRVASMKSFSSPPRSVSRDSVSEGL
ncbi:MAG: Asp-tRNA(Asn)/Glu-tRNA(Gln) amidotransferase subunit GatC [bacterium]|nr:Asp-tRNA(Asn)/Glu-tRNA(Gln) amidotransferase subunit GatC [bacterium]